MIMFCLSHEWYSGDKMIGNIYLVTVEHLHGSCGRKKFLSRNSCLMFMMALSVIRHSDSKG